MAITLKCMEHGNQLAVILQPEGSISSRLSANCGCSKEVDAGSDTEAWCPEHGYVSIIVTRMCARCQSHGEAILRCLCIGQIFIDGRLSVFTRKESSA